MTHVSICWDTSPDGQPVAHEGATVTVTSGGEVRSGVTDAEGLANIDNIPVGSATVEVSQPRYGTQTTTATITAGATADANAQIELTSNARGCTRQHTQLPPGTPGVHKEEAIFWASWWPIILLHVIWVVAMLALVVFTLIAIIDIADGTMHFPLGGFSLVAVLLGTVAFLSHIIFGELAGIPLMIAAGLAWLAMIGITIASALGVLPNLPVNLVWFPTLCGMWTGFFAGMIAGRTDSFTAEHHSWYIAIFAAVGLVVALVLYFVLAALASPTFWADGWAVFGLFWVVLITGIVWALIGGATGHVIVNDHNLESFTQSDPPKLLPYAGEYHCVQGNRGWFSHFGTELLCYDFEVPEGTPILAIEEGHVVLWRDFNMHSLYTHNQWNDPNHIYVEHKDGSVARYLHLKHEGVQDANPVLVANSQGHGLEKTADVHVHAGQVLGYAGSTGMSRFPHIHLGLYRAATGSSKLGLVFSDASTQRHGGKCYTFRAYQSDNVNRGQISI